MYSVTNCRQSDNFCSGEDEILQNNKDWEFHVRKKERETYITYTKILFTALGRGKGDKR